MVERSKKGDTSKKRGINPKISGNSDLEYVNSAHSSSSTNKRKKPSADISSNAVTAVEEILQFEGNFIMENEKISHIFARSIWDAPLSIFNPSTIVVNLEQDTAAIFICMEFCNFDDKGDGLEFNYAYHYNDKNGMTRKMFFRNLLNNMKPLFTERQGVLAIVVDSSTHGEVSEALDRY